MQGTLRLVLHIIPGRVTFFLFSPPPRNSPKRGFAREQLKPTLRVFDTADAEEPDEEMKAKHENVAKETTLSRSGLLKMCSASANDHFGTLVC